MSAKLSASIALRSLETIFAIVILGLSAGFLSDIDGNYPRVTLCVASSSLSLIYLFYVEFFVPAAFNFSSPSIVILICEIADMILFLASMGATAAVITDNCQEFVDSINASNGFATCHIIPALTTFTLIEWLLFTSTFILFTIYSYGPEVRRYGLFHCFKFSEYEWGCIFAIYDGFGRRFKRKFCGRNVSPDQVPPQPTNNQEEIVPVDEAEVGNEGVINDNTEASNQKFVDTEEPELK